jgi:hypothetical protein
LSDSQRSYSPALAEELMESLNIKPTWSSGTGTSTLPSI